MARYGTGLARTLWRGRAPSLITSTEHPRAGEALWADAVDAVVAPASAFGGAGVLSLADQVGTACHLISVRKKEFDL